MPRAVRSFEEGRTYLIFIRAGEGWMELADEVGKSREGGSKWCRRESAGREEAPELAATAQAPN